MAKVQQPGLRGFILIVIFEVALMGVSAFLISGTPSRADEFGADGGPEVAAPDAGSAEFGQPQVLSEEEAATDPELFEKNLEILPERYLIRSTPWRAPNYSGQDGALGWEPDLFKIPQSLKIRVEFWKGIYSKYTTDQGVLHDIDDLGIVYEALDFQSIMSDSQMSLRSKARARTKLVDSRRADISKRLERLSRIKSEKDLKDDIDKKLFSQFAPEKAQYYFQKNRTKELKALRSKLQTSARRKKIRFQLGQKDKFILGIYYSGRYLREMEKHFRAERLPIELTRLPFVESSFNIQARSRVGASGVWQFMPRTAKPWMMVNKDVDERNDPMASTVAAARLMRANFDRLKTWPLALTAYNHGATGVARAVRKTGTRDLAVIIDNYSTRRFGFASSNFYACFLAALAVEREARTLLGDVKWSLEFNGAEVDISKPARWKTLVDLYDGEAPLAELQNPHLTQQIKKQNREIPRGTFVRVPASRAELMRDFTMGKIAEVELQRRIAVTPIPRMAAGPGGEESLRDKIGIISEAAKSLLPLLSPSTAESSTNSSPSSDSSVSPDGGEGFPE